MRLKVVALAGVIVGLVAISVSCAYAEQARRCRFEYSFYVEPVAAQYRDVQGWSQRHDDALEFLGWPQRLRSVVSMVADGAQSIGCINLGIPPNDEAWTRELVESLTAQHCFIEIDDTGRYYVTARGKRMLGALKELPAEAKRQVYQEVWVLGGG